MTGISSIQEAFAARLFNGKSRPPAFLMSSKGPLTARFDVYRNNIFAGLISVLKSRFPAVSRIVGDEFFAGFARQFIAQHPPQSPALVFYGSGFADYIRAAEECADVPYLADVAAIEWELHRCYHAADDVILTAEDLARTGLRPDQIRLHLAASTAVVTSKLPAYSIWRANAQSEPSGPLVFAANGETTLITRCGLSCSAILMPAGGPTFTRAIAAGLKLTEAAQHTAASDPAFRLDQVLGLMLHQNAFAIHPSQSRRSAP